MMTKSWRRLAEALGPGMIDLKKFKDMDRQAGRPDQMPGGSGFFSKDDVNGDVSNSMRPPLQFDVPMDDIDDNGEDDEGDDEFGMGMLSGMVRR